MYPSKNKCFSNETKACHSKAATWILIIFSVLIFVILILGVCGIVKASTGTLQINSGVPIIPENENLENSENSIFENDIPEAIQVGIDDVSVPEVGFDSGIDVEAGWIEVVDYNVPTSGDILPLVIDQAEVDPWSITVHVWGGYTPEDGKILVFQNKECLQGVIDIEWTQLLGAYGGPMRYKASFVVEKSIFLDSNHYPEILPTGFPAMVLDCPPVEDLDKFVSFVICTDWEGCPKPDQAFKVILAHKVMFPEFKTLNEQSSPVSK